MMKTCTKCGDTKPLSEFPARKLRSGKLSHRGACTSCYKAERSQYRREHYLKNREKQLAQCAEYRDANRESRRAQRMEYYYANKDRQRAAMASWYRRNKDDRRAKNKAWFQQHPEKMKEYKLIYEGKREAATPAWFERELVRQVYARAADLGMQVDHIVPLNSDRVCGLHCHANLQLLEGNMNRSKSNRYWPDMPGEES